MLQYLSQREKEQLFHDSLHLLELTQTYVLIFLHMTVSLLIFWLT